MDQDAFRQCFDKNVICLIIQKQTNQQQMKKSRQKFQVVYNNNKQKMKTKKQLKAKQQILNTIPIFLAKTYKIVDNPEYKDIISWTEDGQSFIVKDINKLTTEIFPKHFKHSNFASFVRQLNMYGFHKVKSEEEGHAFTHESFQKNQVQKLKDIKRRNGVGDPQQANETNMMVPVKRSQDSQFEKELNLIKNKHDDLQNFVSMLVQQNKEILLQNRNFVSKMSKMQEKYRNKLQTLMLLLLFGKAKNSNGQPFILPQQFQNMLQSFTESNNMNNGGFEIRSDGIRKKKPKRQQPLKMLRNESEAQIQRKFYHPFQQHKITDEVDHMINVSDSEKKQIFRNELDDSIDLIPPSPNHSYMSFPELYEKESHHDVSDFLEKLQHSDYEDLSVADQKTH